MARPVLPVTAAAALTLLAYAVGACAISNHHDLLHSKADPDSGSSQRAGGAAVAPPPPPPPRQLGGAHWHRQQWQRNLAQSRQRALDQEQAQQYQDQEQGRQRRARRRRRRRRPWQKLQFDDYVRRAREEVPASEEAEGCDTRVGVGYLQRWRKLGGVYCNASEAAGGGNAGGGGGGSRVRCNAQPVADLTACLATNMVIHAKAFAGGGKRPADGLPRAPPGSVRLGCNATRPVANFLRGRLRNEGPRRWIVDAARLVPAADVDAACAGAGAVRHAVVFVTRLDGSNAFHNAETLVHLFIGLATLRIPPDLLQDGLQVVIADDKPPGTFLDILRRLSHPHPLATLRTAPWPPGACLRAAAIAPFVGHGNSLLAAAAEEVGCRSVMLTAAAHWLRDLFRDLLPREQRAGGPGPPPDEGDGGEDGQQQLQFVWLSRARFEAGIRGKMTGWQRQRVAPNEPEVVTALQEAVARWNRGACAVKREAGCRASNLLFNFQSAELSDLPFAPDQVSLLARTAVLAGVHGAGLTNALLMEPGRGAVVEVWHGMEDNYHYANLAAALGHAYENIKSEGKLPVDRIVEAAARAMDAAARRHAKPRPRRGGGRRGGAQWLMQRLGWGGGAGGEA